MLFWGAHQEDDVGVLVESSGHADPLSLSSTQVDALSHSGTITLKHGQKLSRQSHANYAKWWAYPLSDLSLVTERQQVDVRLQRAGVNHRFVPGKDDVHNIKKRWSPQRETVKRRWFCSCSHLCLLKGLPKVMFSSTVALSSHDFWAA